MPSRAAGLFVSMNKQMTKGISVTMKTMKETIGERDGFTFRGDFSLPGFPQ